MRGELPSVQIGKSRRVPVTAIHGYVDRLVSGSKVNEPALSGHA